MGSQMFSPQENEPRGPEEGQENTAPGEQFQTHDAPPQWDAAEDASYEQGYRGYDVHTEGEKPHPNPKDSREQDTRKGLTRVGFWRGSQGRGTAGDHKGPPNHPRTSAREVPTIHEPCETFQNPTLESPQGVSLHFMKSHHEGDRNPAGQP